MSTRAATASTPAVPGPLSLAPAAAASARIDVIRARTRAPSVGTAAVTVPSPGDPETDDEVGAGLPHAFAPSFVMRDEFERHRAGAEL